MSEQSSNSAPVRIEILSSAGNIPILDKDLHEILTDALIGVNWAGDVDQGGETRVKIECIVDEDEKERFLGFAEI